jgi:hypothetical protein
MYGVECAKDSQKGRNGMWVEEEVLAYCSVRFENFQELKKTNVYGWSLTKALKKRQYIQDPFKYIYCSITFCMIQF